MIFIALFLIQQTECNCHLPSYAILATAQHSPSSESNRFSASLGIPLPSTTTMAESRITPQDFQPAQRPKRKRGQLPTSSGASPSFLSPNQFAVLSDSESDIEETRASPKTPDRTTRIPPIVVYSLFDNHSATLKQVNDKLTSPVDVKSKTDRLLYTKSSADYNILLSEIKSAKLAYHTYLLPEAVQPRLVLKGIPPNVPEEDVRADLNTHNIQVARIS